MKVLDLRWCRPLHISQLSQLLLAGIIRRPHLVVSRHNVSVFMVDTANAYGGVAHCSQK
jgi:hypothetical protein